MLIFSASLISVGLAACSPSAMHETSYSWVHPGDTLRRSSGRSSALYSPTFGEGKFCELCLDGVFRSSHGSDPFGPSLPKSHSLSCDLAAPVWCRGSWYAPRSREPLSSLRLRALPDARRPLPRSARRSPRWG